jgi:hypothetical protein
VHLLFWIRIRIRNLKLRVWILQKVSDPYGSGSTSLHAGVRNSRCGRTHALYNLTNVFLSPCNLPKNRPRCDFCALCTCAADIYALSLQCIFPCLFSPMAGHSYLPHLSFLVLQVIRAGHVERYQLQSYRFKPFFVTL